MDYYHCFHDSYIANVIYDFRNSRLELFIDIWWSGNPLIKEDGTYETNKVKLKLVCTNIQQYNFKEKFSDYIEEAYLKYITINNKQYLCFATDNENPLISIVCDSIEYEEVIEQ